MRLAQERLHQAEDRLAQLRAKAEGARTMARSPDNVITAVVDGRGELVSVTLNTAKWRRMAPAELGAALVKTINKAREDGRAELMGFYRGMVPEPLLPPGAAEGQMNIEEMFNRMLGRGSGS
jgi:hypothetical protein